MSAPLNEPIYSAIGDQPNPTPEDPRFTRSGVYVESTYNDLSASGVAPSPTAAFPAPSNQLGEQDYRGGAYASGADVDRHINTDQVHGPAYGELGPRPFPN